MANVEIKEYQRYTPQTIGGKVLSLAVEAQRDGTFPQREIVGVGIRNRTLDEAVKTAIEAVKAEGLHPYVICRDDEIVGAATVFTGLDLYKIKYPFIPVKLARRLRPIFSEQIQDLGANVFAWTTEEHTQDGVLGEAYEQIVSKGLDISANVWTIEPRTTSPFVTEAIIDSGLQLAGCGYYDDGEATGFMHQEYDLYTAAVTKQGI